MNRKPGLATPLTLPCGAVVPNRLVKAAMTEGLATMDGVPTPQLERLYGLWSDGGAGVLISGNVQIDRQHLEQPGNVIIDGESSQTGHERWGDYAGIGVDPDDDCTFWFTSEYQDGTGWATQITSFRFEACGCDAPIDPLVAAASADRRGGVRQSAFVEFSPQPPDLFHPLFSFDLLAGLVAFDGFRSGPGPEADRRKPGHSTDCDHKSFPIFRGFGQ